MYVKQAISILLYRKLKKKNLKTGTVPIYLRLTIDGLEEEISTSINLQPEGWDQATQPVLTTDPEAKEKNDGIRDMTTDLKQHFHLVQAQYELATPALVLKAYKTPLRAEKTRAEEIENLAFSETLDDLLYRYIGYQDRYVEAHSGALPPHPTKAALLEEQRNNLEGELKAIIHRGNKIFDDRDWEKTMVLAINEHLLHFMELSFAGVRAHTTLEKMWGRKKRFVEFLQHRYETIDLPIKSIQLKMADQVLMYNITEHHMAENSAMKYVQFLKEILTRSTSLQWVPANVFDSYRCHYEDTDRKWPTPAELEEFRTTEFETPLQNRVRDCYVAGCYTGYAYAELYGLKPDMIALGIDAKRWGAKTGKRRGLRTPCPCCPSSWTWSKNTRTILSAASVENASPSPAMSFTTGNSRRWPLSSVGRSSSMVIPAGTTLSTRWPTPTASPT